MNNSFIPSKEWFQSALMAVRAADQRKTLEEYLFKLTPIYYQVQNNRSFHKDVLDSLIRDQIIIKAENNRMILGHSHAPEWLIHCMSQGIKEAWEIHTFLFQDNDDERLFNNETLKKIGTDGELFIVQLLKEKIDSSLHEKINHVAKKDDTRGYDIISPSTRNTDNLLFIEVKTTTRVVDNYFSFYISRNEISVGLKNRNWIIACVVKESCNHVLLGHIYGHQIESRMPIDPDNGTKWMSCQLKIETDLIRRELP